MTVGDIVDLSNAMKSVLERLGVLREDETGRPFAEYPDGDKLNDCLLDLTHLGITRDLFIKALNDLGTAFNGFIDEEADL